MFSNDMLPIAVGLIVFAFLLASLRAVRLAQEYQRAVIFRFGRDVGIRGPGLFLVWPFGIERSVFVDMRTITVKLETQETLTSDGVAVRVNAVLWYHASDATKTVMKVVDWNKAVVEAAETALRDTIGQRELDGLLKDRLAANDALKVLLTKAVAKWGVEIESCELKDLDIPGGMQRAIAKEAEAIREKRARIIKAEGEKEASQKLSEAAAIMEANPISLELRRLQTLAEIGAEHNSTIVVSMPSDGSLGNMAAMAKALSNKI